MYIRQIELKDIKGFADLKFSLEREKGVYAGWTVFTGDNGAGKSSLLRAISIALAGKDVARQLQPSFRGWVREGAAIGSVKLEIIRNSDFDSFVEGGRTTKASFISQLQIHQEDAKEPLLENGKEHEKSREAARSLWHPNSQGWFACGYGPFRRVFGASPEAARQMVSPSTERFVTMFHEAASLAEVDQWMKDLRHKSLENRPNETAQLTLLLDFLKDGLLPEELEIDRIDSDGLWLRDRNGVNLSWQEMSDGYRAALALLGDILRHIMKTYGTINIAREHEGKLQARVPGVVLIDEIDAHLHPEWQQRIGFWLKDRFPLIQFLVSTHSPIVCQAADLNGLFFLPAPGSNQLPRAATPEERKIIVASRPDTILITPAFGLTNSRSHLAVEARAKKAKLEAKQRVTPLSTQEIQDLQTCMDFINLDESP